MGHPIVRYYLGDNEQRWYLWYTGRSSACRDMDAVFPSSGSVGERWEHQAVRERRERLCKPHTHPSRPRPPPGVAVSEDGIEWARGAGPVTGERGEGSSRDVGRVLAPNPDWWWHDTCHLHAADVQILSNDAVSGGTGVYWMFYSGGSYEEVEMPEGLACHPAGDWRPQVGGRAGGLAGGWVCVGRGGTACWQLGSRGRPAATQGTHTRTPAHPPTPTHAPPPQPEDTAVLGRVEGLRLRPGLAMSPDGRNWARIEAEHHSGALFDVGAAGEWDELFIGAPQVCACVWGGGGEGMRAHEPAPQSMRA